MITIIHIQYQGIYMVLQVYFTLCKKHVRNNNVFNTCFLGCPELGVNMVVQ